MVVWSVDQTCPPVLSQWWDLCDYSLLNPVSSVITGITMGPQCSEVSAQKGNNNQLSRCVMCQKQCRPLFTLPCHVVCTSCLELLVSYRDPADVILCPECHRMYPYTEDWQTHFCTTFRNDQQMTTAIRRCQRCKRRRVNHVSYAEQYCYQCQQPLCCHCHVTLHATSRGRRHHIAVPLVPAEWAMWQQEGVTHCPAHLNQSLSLFCITCSAPLCCTCGETEHAGHEVWDVGTSLKNAQNTLHDRLKTMTEHRTALLSLNNFLCFLHEAVHRRQENEPQFSCFPGNLDLHTHDIAYSESENVTDSMKEKSESTGPVMDKTDKGLADDKHPRDENPLANTEDEQKRVSEATTLRASLSEHMWTARMAYEVLDSRVERLVYELHTQDKTTLTCLSAWINARPVISHKVYTALSHMFSDDPCVETSSLNHVEVFSGGFVSNFNSVLSEELSESESYIPTSNLHSALREMSSSGAVSTSNLHSVLGDVLSEGSVQTSNLHSVLSEVFSETSIPTSRMTSALRDMFPHWSENVPSSGFGYYHPRISGFYESGVRTGTWDPVTGDFVVGTTHSLVSEPVGGGSSGYGSPEDSVTQDILEGIALERKVDEAINAFYARRRASATASLEEAGGDTTDDAYNVVEASTTNNDLARVTAENAGYGGVVSQQRGFEDLSGDVISFGPECETEEPDLHFLGQSTEVESQTLVDSERVGTDGAIVEVSV